MSYRCIAWFVWFCVSQGKAVVFPDAFYLINQSAPWGLRWTLSFGLSKHSLTYCNLDYSKPEVLNFWWTETAFKILIVSLYSIKVAKAELWEQPWKSIPWFSCDKPALNQGPELEIRQAEPLNPLTAFGRTLNHTPFPPFLRVQGAQVLHVAFVSPDLDEYGLSILKGCSQMFQTSVIRHIAGSLCLWGPNLLVFM